jgi:hypothetical protein
MEARTLKANLGVTQKIRGYKMMVTGGGGDRYLKDKGIPGCSP